VPGLDLEMHNPVTPRENSADTGSSPENLGFCEYENSPKEYFGNKQDYRKTTEEILLRKNLANLDSDTNSVKRVRSASEYISPRKNFRTSPRINIESSPRKHFGYSPRENIDGSPRISIESSPRKHYGHSPRDNLGDSRENSTKKNNKRSTKLKDFFGETPPDSPKSPEKLQLTTKSKRADYPGDKHFNSQKKSLAKSKPKENIAETPDSSKKSVKLKPKENIAEKQDSEPKKARLFLPTVSKNPNQIIVVSPRKFSITKSPSIPLIKNLENSENTIAGIISENREKNYSVLGENAENCDTVVKLDIPFKLPKKKFGF